jgi:vitamin B12 transporter
VLGYSGAFGAHTLQADVRRDVNSIYGGNTTGRVGYAFAAGAGVKLRALAGTTFRAPTFNDLAFPGFGVPTIQPERGRSVEVGASWQGDGATLSATLYRNRVRDLIVFQCDANFDCRPNNVANATLEGITLSGALQWRDTGLHGSIDLQSPTDDATGNLLPRRARRHAALSWSQQAGRGRFITELVASSARFDDAENQVPLGGYAIVNLGFEWPLDPRTTLFIRADNVLNRDYELAADFATGGARVFGGVRWRL